MDWIDHSVSMQERLNELEVEEARRKAVLHPPAGFDHEHCVDCEEPIPAVRLNLGFFRCFECQSFLEMKASRIV